MGFHRRVVPQSLRLFRSEMRGMGRTLPLLPEGNGRSRVDGSALKMLVRHLQQQRRQDAEELHRRKASLQALMESLPLKVFVKDARARYVTCNALFAHDRGLTPEQVAGRTDFDFYPLPEAERFRHEDGWALASGSALSVHESQLQDGLEKIVHVVKTPFYDMHGKVAGVVGTLLDVTGNKEIECRLRQFAYENEDLYQYSPCAYQSLDAEGVVRRINNTALDWLGYKRDEIVGQLHLDDLLSESSRLRFAATLSDFVRLGELHGLTLDLVRKDGCLLPVSLQATAIYDDEGHFAGSHLTFSDMALSCELVREQRVQQRYLDAYRQSLGALRREERQRLIGGLQSCTMPQLDQLAQTLAVLADGLSVGLPEAVGQNCRTQLETAQRLLDQAISGVLDVCSGASSAALDHMVRTDCTVRTAAEEGDLPVFERRKNRCRRLAIGASATVPKNGAKATLAAGFVERRSGALRRSQDRWQMTRGQGVPFC